jgi:hypothetical protein
MPPFICTSQAAGISCTSINELAAGTETSSVPVITNVGSDIFDSWLQTPSLLMDT